jgi:glutamyl-Q tRNA(Asp) synthetase
LNDSQKVSSKAKLKSNANGFKLNYIGRFAPSPTGPLHAGSVATALGSWLDARAHQGLWLLRIEDIDTHRNANHAVAHIMHTLEHLGLKWDGQVLYQSQRAAAYQSALNTLVNKNRAYRCACSRKEIADSLTQTSGDAATRATLFEHTRLIYPGTCAQGIVQDKPARSTRFRVPNQPITWQERLHGRQFEQLTQSCGDFIIHRADGVWAYQLAVVVDDADQGITHIVRGADLMNSTARQIALQHALHFPTPSYCHLPVVLASNGEKLSKQNGAEAVCINQPIVTLNAAFTHLQFNAIAANTVQEWLQKAVCAWAIRFPIYQQSKAE